MRYINAKKRGVLMLIGISCGLLWGLMEAAIRFGLRSACPDAAIGSILTGLSFFYLAAARTASRSSIAPLIALASAILLKAGATILLGGSCAGASVLNPAFAFGLQTLTFLSFGLVSNRMGSNFTLFHAAGGGLTAFTAAMLFPLSAPLAGLTVCSAALSFHYAPWAALVGVFSLPAGTMFGSYFSGKLPELNRNHNIEWAFLNLFAAAGTLWISVLTR